MPPKIYLKSAIKAALDGLGEGTVYAAATSAVVSQSGKTFVLSGLTIITDIGADADDKFNSYFLYFPASGNKYLIVDWIASSNTATTWEVPATGDTGACEIRRGVVDVKALAANPVLFLGDSRRDADWKSAANMTLDIYLPNFLGNGGFESNDLPPWIKAATGGSADTSGGNTTSPILGFRDYTLDRGDRTTVVLRQPIIYDLEPNRTYQILFKGRFTTSLPQDSFEVGFLDALENSDLPVTFSSQTSGTISGTAWKPLLTASNTWHSVDFTVPAEGIPAGSKFGFKVLNTADIANIDEVYLYEKINVDSLVIFDHLSGEQYGKIFGRRCASDRTGFTAAVEDSELVSGTTTLVGKKAHLVEFTAGAFPIYSIVATSFKQASEILLGETWAWGKGPQRPFGLQTEKKNQTMRTSRSGVVQKIIHHTKKSFKNTLTMLSEVDRLILINDYKPNHFDKNNAFAVVIQSGDVPLLMLDNMSEFDPTYQNIRPNWSFDFEEVIS